jgi:DNA (cytosine-5)-methyltransferase 1
VADGAAPRLRRVEDYPALLNEAWAQAHAPRAANAPTVISTFAGCGGSSLGYHMAGFRELLAVEWEQNAADTFRLNFPHVPLYHGDIAKLSVDECLRLAGVKPGELTVFDGSPPCQGFSTAGKREIGDARNQLFREYCRLLEGLRPRAFVMENVSGMVKGDFKLVFAEILRTLKRCGYRVKARLLNAMWFGVPQSRERVIFVGVREDIAREPSHPAGWSEPVSINEASTRVPVRVAEVASLVASAARYANYRRWHELRPGQSLADIGDAGGHSCMKLDPLRPCPAILKKDGDISARGKMHWSEKRRPTTNEFMRWGSFPDAFRFIGDSGESVERIGNSVPPLMMRSIAAHVRTLVS